MGDRVKWDRKHNSQAEGLTNFTIFFGLFTFLV